MGEELRPRCARSAIVVELRQHSDPLDLVGWVLRLMARSWRYLPCLDLLRATCIAVRAVPQQTRSKPHLFASPGEEDTRAKMLMQIPAIKNANAEYLRAFMSLPSPGAGTLVSPKRCSNNPNQTCRGTKEIQLFDVVSGLIHKDFNACLDSGALNDSRKNVYLRCLVWIL